MKNLLQATGLIATALLITTGCEFPVDVDSEEPFEKIVYLGKIIYKPKYATFSAPFAIEDSPSTNVSSNKINTVQIDFENQRIHYYGKTDAQVKCYFDRPMDSGELISMENLIRDLEFCEMQTTGNTACLASFMPTDSIFIYDYQRLHYIDEFSNYCSANSPQLCNSADIEPLFTTIKTLAIQDIDNCQPN